MNDPARPSTALHTDFYQLTMAVGYLHRGMAHTRVTCEAFVRRLPGRRSFLLVAGLAEILQHLQDLRFTEEQLDFLAAHPVLGPALDGPTRQALAGLRFSGDVWAMPEGSVAFAGEPLLRVEAELWQAQLAETVLLSLLNHATGVASKAARIVLAANPAGVLEFGTRRTHDEAAVAAARAAYIAGCRGSSNVEAGFRHGVPVFGTAAHMWTMAHPSEAEAFDAYLDVYPGGTTLLVDTYDIREGTRRACAAARRRGDPEALGGVRVDCELFDEAGRPSGICAEVRRILDAEGFGHTRVVVSGDMNEDRIGELRAAGEPIDLYGVGTELVTSKDAPALGGVYKLTQVEQGEAARPVIKLGRGKVTYPGRHQVYRELDGQGRVAADHLVLVNEQETPAGEPLLQQVMAGGRTLLGAAESLQAMRQRAEASLATLPREAALGHEDVITVRPSAALQALTEQMRRKHGG